MLQIVTLFAAVVVLSVLATHRTQILLSRTLEKTVARQAADFSVMAEQRFEQEFSTLSLAAGLLAADPDEAEKTRILSELQGKEPGVSVGILSVEGKVLTGNYVSRRSFHGLPQAFRGQNVVDYGKRDGLLFAVPIRRGNFVRAVLYRLYDNAVLADRFILTAYHPSVHLLLWSKEGEIIVPYKRFGERDERLLHHPEIQAAIGDLRKQLVNHRAAAVCVAPEGKKVILFSSDLPQTNCSVAGYVPWEAVAGDIALVHERLFRSIGILLLVALIVGVYLFQVRKKAEESDALRWEKELADTANRTKGIFLANMSHEIRTPINAVLGMNEMILREGKDPNVAAYARNIQSAGRTLLALINDVLDFSKIESGKIEIVEGDYRLSDLLRNAVNMAKPRAEGKGLSFGLEVDGTLPDVLRGDMNRVQQIVVNLLTNAAKYTEKGSVTFRVSGERDAAAETVTLRFVVEDTGIGIREEDKERLFNHFERLDTVRNQSIEGTGLGLAIAKRLATLMGGDVVFDSTYGVGSVFTITIPQKIVRDEPIGDIEARLSGGETTPVYRASFTAPEANLLVADDNEMNLMVVKGLLKKTKVKIDAVTGGKAALDLMKVKHYDAVLLDHRMPDMDGVETLQAAKELPNVEGTPFLILTADAITGMREYFLHEGFDDYLAKPVDGELLEQALMRYLPAEKVLPADAADESPEAPRIEAPKATEEETGADADAPPVLDKAIGLQYSGGQEDFYRELADMFVQLHPKKKAQIEAYFAAEDWKSYADDVHALKSSSLSIGGCRLSAAAKESEAAGRQYLSDTATAEEKEAALAKLRDSHEKLMALYDEFAEEARKLAEDSEKIAP